MREGEEDRMSGEKRKIEGEGDRVRGGEGV